MNTATTWETESTSLENTWRLGEAVGRRLKGGEVIELISDLGGGKTAFVKGLAKGIGSEDETASPTFTISRVYCSDQGIPPKRLCIYHYDFYRLNEPGVVELELEESLKDKDSAVAIEWASTVDNVLPKDRLRVKIKATGENKREFAFLAGKGHAHLIEDL